jgi:TPR repeat protein
MAMARTEAARRLSGMLVGLMLCVAGQQVTAAYAGDAEFELAQAAAKGGRYRDVIEILDELLLEPDLGTAGQVVAYSNRGIAYSLLSAYGLAKQDLEEAHRLDPQHRLTLNHLGMIEAEVDGNPKAAVRYFEQAALAGFAPSQVALADLLLKGEGVAKDERRAFGLYLLASEANYPLAYAGLGEMLMHGIGTTRDAAQAILWLKRAGSAGVVEANYQLGLAYEVGTGVRIDTAAAVAHYLTAGRQGHVRAQIALGYMYRHGWGVAQSYIKAAHWYRLGADQGEAAAQNRLAWLLAACPVEDVCSGEAAVSWAQQAIQQTSIASYLDSLAAGYARMGEFELAINTQQRALSTDDLGGDDRASYERRLHLYRRGEPYQL